MAARSTRPLPARSRRDVGAADHSPTGRGRAAGVHDHARDDHRPGLRQADHRRAERREDRLHELSSFSATAGQLVRAALQEFEKAGVRYWILDLRDNGGGYVYILQQIAGNFIRDGQPVAYSIDRSGEQAEATNPSLYVSPQHPFAVLINAGSASASEAFAAAAQDYGFARTFGQTSSGCLAAALLFDLADGSALSVTVQKVVSPKKRQINGIGVKPDQEIPVDPMRADDATLQAAVAWLVVQPQPAAPRRANRPYPCPACPQPVPGVAATPHPPRSCRRCSAACCSSAAAGDCDTDVWCEAVRPCVRKSEVGRTDA
ncbi:MAG: S41 family peptidase [Chloroflexia bacterium]